MQGAQEKRSWRAESPSGRLVLEYTAGSFFLKHDGQPVLTLPAVGITTTLQGNNLTFMKMKKNGRVKVDYRMLEGKRLQCSNRGNSYTFIFKDNAGRPQQLVARLFDDGLAFRYELTGLKDERLTGEQTTYRIPEGTRRWIMHWTDSSEDFFPLSTSGAAPAEWPYFDSRNDHRRWGYPALFEVARKDGGESLYALVTEANIERRQSASSLKNDVLVTDYRVFPERNDLALSGDWHSPWRVVIVGSLADVVESTLVTDVSEPCQLADTSWIHPGVVSWVYWAYNHGSNDYDIICKYTDLAVALKLPYVLIDAEWNEMKDGKTIEDAVSYACSKGVKPLIWYNSSIGWVNGAPGPKYRLNKPEDLEREFAWCERIGVAGIKVDFFNGEGQPCMDFCLDLLEAAARHRLLINFHGAAIPRGWQRTYPNLLSTEGVYGAEWYNNVPSFTRRAARHNATLPFTRNVVGPMDYTPCAFSDSQHPHITSHAHELALTVLFESGLQHLADRPESFLAQPAAVQQFLSHLPVAWDETRLISGYPGESVVVARQNGQTWYVAGVNGRDEAQTLDLKRLASVIQLSRHREIRLFADSGRSDNPWTISSLPVSELPSQITCQPRGGFVIIIR